MRKAIVTLVCLSLVLPLGGCVLIDEVAEGWMVLRHYQQLQAEDKRRRQENKKRAERYELQTTKEPDDE